MPVYLLPEEPVFPDVSEAESDGLLALGGDFSPARLLNAYASGIFPWFRDEDDIFWFSPDPRLVLYPQELKISDSLQRVIRSKKYYVTADEDFLAVMRECALAERPGQDGTWIDEAFIEGYTRLHELGFAHSFEAWTEGELVGGLYGVSLGKAFFGESMFHKKRDASKVAFCAMVEKIKTWQFSFVDCQVETDLLKRLGARPVARTDYITGLEKALKHPTRKGRWKL
jgi:leucyl/phenylalanyl-tRNA--protein transferase